MITHKKRKEYNNFSDNQNFVAKLAMNELPTLAERKSRNHYCSAVKRYRMMKRVREFVPLP